MMQEATPAEYRAEVQRLYMMLEQVCSATDPVAGGTKLVAGKYENGVFVPPDDLPKIVSGLRAQVYRSLLLNEALSERVKEWNAAALKCSLVPNDQTDLTAPGHWGDNQLAAINKLKETAASEVKTYDGYPISLGMGVYILRPRHEYHEPTDTTLTWLVPERHTVSSYCHSESETMIGLGLWQEERAENCYYTHEAAKEAAERLNHG